MKRKNAAIRYLPVILLLIFLLTGCTASGPAQSLPAERTTFAMDTLMELKAYCGDDVLDRCVERIAELEKIFSVTDPESEIYSLNDTGTSVLGNDASILLKEALSLCERTGGALDISIYPVVRAWGFTTGEYRIPAKEELAELRKRVDYSKVEMNGSSVSIPDGMMIDLGSVAKGYCSDCLAEMLKEAGVKSALLNLGGNIYALGTKPDGTKWNIGIQDPNGSGYLGVLKASDLAVITSGGYERYFEENGKVYWHIMDPATGEPASNGLISVSVIGSRGVVCDGLSTALFVMGLDRAAQMWRDSEDFEAVFVTDTGSIYITEGLKDDFHTAGAYASEEIQVITHE